MVSTPASPASRALRSDLHLACLRGPDRGCVFPVQEGPFGRGLDFMGDPYTSRKGGAILRGSGVGSRWTLLLDDGSVDLRPGRRIWIGTNLWQVRVRPAEPDWPAQKVEIRGQRTVYLRYLRWALPAFMLAFLVRMAPSQWRWIILMLVGAVGVAAAVLVGRRARRKDEAALLLAAQAQVAAQETLLEEGSRKPDGSSALRLLRRPGHLRRVPITLDPIRPVAVYGAEAQPYARWLRGQLVAAGRKASESGRQIVVAPTVSGAPLAASLALPGLPLGSAAWSRQMDLVLRPPDALPPSITLTELNGPIASGSVRLGWSERKPVAVGLSESGPVSVDPIANGPHMLVVGGTGSGKSEFLTTLILSLALTYPPTALHFMLLDFKGGAGLSHLSALPHVEECVSDLDGASAAWLLRALSRALRVRKELFGRHGWRSFEEAVQVGSSLPRLLVVVDEFQALADQHPDLMDHLALLGSQGRSLGMHLVLSTQRPGGALGPQLRAILDLRVALRCSEERDSRDAIGSALAARLPRIPGRAIVGGQIVQTALTEEPATVVELLRTLAAEAGPAEDQRLLPRPLPDADKVPTVGVFEDPSDGSLVDLSDLPLPALFCGPAAVDAELQEMAAATLEGICGLAGNQPTPEVGRVLWMGSSTPPLLPAGFTCQAVDPNDPCATAYALTLAARPGPTFRYMFVGRVQKILATLESAAPASRVAELWDAVTARARLGGIGLLVTDSGSRQASTPRTTVLRLPSRSTLIDPRLASLLPTTIPGTGGLPVTRASDLDGYVSAQWGRGLISGLPGKEEAVWAQFARPRLREPPEPSGRAEGSTGLWRLSSSPTPDWPDVGQLVIGTHVGQVLEELLEQCRPRLGDLDVRAATSWHPGLLPQRAEVVFVGVGPDTLRMLAGRFPHEAVWCSVWASRKAGAHLWCRQGHLDPLSDATVFDLLDGCRLDTSR